LTLAKIALLSMQYHQCVQAQPSRWASCCPGVNVDLDTRLTRKEAADRIGLSPATIGMWKARGKLATDEHGRYRLGDVLAVELETRYSPNNRVPRAGLRHVVAA
jgi:hypothetical protein